MDHLAEQIGSLNAAQLLKLRRWVSLETKRQIDAEWQAYREHGITPSTWQPIAFQP